VQVVVSEKDINTAKALKSAKDYLERQSEHLVYLQKKVDDKNFVVRHFSLTFGDARIIHIYDQGEVLLPDEVMRALNDELAAHATSLHARLVDVVNNAISNHSIKLSE
jgi:hypothetical protein